MGWKESLQRPESRTRLLGVILVLATLLTLPSPAGTLSFLQVALSVQMLALAAFAWSLWFRPDLQWTLWGASFLLSLFLFFRGVTLFPALLLSLWFIWYRIRLKNLAKLKVLTALLLSASAASLWAKSSTVKPGDIQIPAYLRGYALNEIVSCGQVDKIPWKFRAEGRKTRLILKDTLRLNSETKFSTWEIYQVMDKYGYVSYIFRRALKSGQYESIVAKENHYNRIIETAKGKKVVDVQNLKNFINRAVFTFTHADEGTVSYLPGLAGRSVITMQLSQAEGRLLPPLFIKGSVCDRPSDENAMGDQAAGGTTDSGPPAPAAPAAGAAK